MCGIAGYSIHRGAKLDRTLAAQALLAGIAERGADAVGYAYRAPEQPISVHKQRSGASELLERVSIVPDATDVLIHVRDYTKGHPRILANNHPIRHGAIVGVHNGIIFNDEDVLERHGIGRAHPEMTVDSEAIFALAEHANGHAGALEELRGSMATAWLDERHPETVFAARGVGRPLWLGHGEGVTFFASTKHTLDLVERFVRRRLRKRELAEGTLVALQRGRPARSERFRPDRRFEEEPLPAVRAPGESASCIRRLNALAAAA
jgi:glucosamine 6-phosphate synthetase-like amidotransferase/phosphosugar isomerase protein